MNNCIHPCCPPTHPIHSFGLIHCKNYVKGLWLCPVGNGKGRKEREIHLQDKLNKRHSMTVVVVWILPLLLLHSNHRQLMLVVSQDGIPVTFCEGGLTHKLYRVTPSRATRRHLLCWTKFYTRRDKKQVTGDAPPSTRHLLFIILHFFAGWFVIEEDKGGIKGRALFRKCSWVGGSCRVINYPWKCGRVKG